MFDNVCKFLAENFSSDFAEWLLGESIDFSELSPSELSLEPIRADTLILLQAEEIILHLEFQTYPTSTIPFRMLDYWVRIYRRFPNRKIRQVVIYLKETSSPLTQTTRFERDQIHHEFQVIRLWEQPIEILLRTPGLLYCGRVRSGLF